VKQFDASTRKGKQTRRAKMQTYLNQVPKTLSLDLLNVTVCCRYTESLLTNPRIKRYLAKYHPEQLTEIQNLITEIEGIVRS
jgi:hypothetical protein